MQNVKRVACAVCVCMTIKCKRCVNVVKRDATVKCVNATNRGEPTNVKRVRVKVKRQPGGV